MPSFHSNKDLNFIKKGIISGEKIINSGNYAYEYVHSFFGKLFYPSRYNGIFVARVI